MVQRILVIDDEPVVCVSCSRILSESGHEVVCRQDPREGLEAALTGEYDIILLDLMMPELDGLEILQRLKAANVTSEVAVITGYAAVQTAVEAMREGAADYVSKPFTPDELKMAVQKLVDRSALIRENVLLRQELEARQGFEGILGDSRPMMQVFSMVKRVAPTQGTVLITGESGTGKELVARAIHQLSPRRAHPFLACDCSALAPSLLESELFGHVKGSFSGAIASKKGLFEVAGGGTLFLDEISNIDLETQGKLLRVLESRRVKKVGDTEEREVDIRLIGATNRDLGEMVRRQQFREDLYYRLNVVPLQLPPLRDRRGDIVGMAVSFLARFRRENAVKVEGFSPEAMRLLEDYSWPGNVRELKNVVERLAILCDSTRVEARHIPADLRQGPASSLAVPLPRSWEEFKNYKRQLCDNAVREVESQFLREALSRCEGNISRAAEEVGMQRTNFHALMRKYGLSAASE